ncbi:helix-turn-helix domain-containing protein [Halalkalicoccus tibetensis]|uniref:ArsR family transcriptional regulator n=1 Tax=Halalkalicoccus tibetensis TaxID=175632 RepID=A0ABD5UY79_9EURY
MTSQWDPDGIFEVLASQDSRRILAAASVRPLSARELEQVCDASLPTIYRRVNVLLDYGLLSEEQFVDSSGKQYMQYTTDLEEINIRVEDGGFNVNLEIRKDAVDKFGDLFRDLGEGRRGGEAGDESVDLSDITEE